MKVCIMERNVCHRCGKNMKYCDICEMEYCADCGECECELYRPKNREPTEAELMEMLNRRMERE